MEPVSNPHDKLFKETWSDKESAREFLRCYLPPEVLCLIDLNSLTIAKDSFIEQDLQEYFSDILYHVKFGKLAGYVYLLFEHKSFPDRFTHLQLLEYLVKIWRLWLKQQEEQKKHTRSPRYLPLILPMVLYHGERGWTTSTQFADLFAGPKEALHEYIPDFTYLLYDLIDYADDEIKGTVLARVVMLLFKHIHDPDLLERLPAILTLLQEILNTPNGLRCVEMILRYVFSAVESVTVEQIKTVTEQALKGEFTMTLAEQLEKKGYEKGLVEAIELGLSLRFGDETVQKIMPIVRAIHDLTRLQAIKEALKHTQNLAELQTMIGVST